MKQEYNHSSELGDFLSRKGVEKEISNALEEQKTTIQEFMRRAENTWGKGFEAKMWDDLKNFINEYL